MLQTPSNGVVSVVSGLFAVKMLVWEFLEGVFVDGCVVVAVIHRHNLNTTPSLLHL